MNNAYSGQVFIVEDEDDLADLYAAVLESVALPYRRFSNGETFLAALENNEWGAVILDLRMPGMGGMAVLRKLRERQSPLAVLIVTGHGEIRTAVDAIQLGAVNFLEKPFSNEALISNVQKAIQESRRQFAHRERQKELLDRYHALSPRGQQIARLVTRGLTSKEIADEVHISARTVEVHRARVLEHLKCETSIEMARLLHEIDQLLSRG